MYKINFFYDIFYPPSPVKLLISYNTPMYYVSKETPLATSFSEKYDTY